MSDTEAMTPDRGSLQKGGPCACRRGWNGIVDAGRGAVLPRERGTHRPGSSGELQGHAQVSPMPKPWTG